MGLALLRRKKKRAKNRVSSKKHTHLSMFKTRLIIVMLPIVCIAKVETLPNATLANRDSHLISLTRLVVDRQLKGV